MFKGCFIVAVKIISFDAKEGRREEILEIIELHERTRRFTSANASTMRGKTTFLSNQMTGRVLKGCSWALAHRQYVDKIPAVVPYI